MYVVPEGTKLNSDAIVAGFHGIGATGYWTVKFLIGQLNAKRSLYIDSDYAPAVTSTVAGKLVTPFEVFTFEKLSFLKAEIPPAREKENKFYRKLGLWILESGVKEAALVGGLDDSLRSDDSSYRVVCTSAMSAKGDLKGEPVLEEERMIVGPVASLLNVFEMHEFPAYAILAYSSTERVDPRAAASAIDFLSRRYKLTIDTSPLIKGAEALEQEVESLENREKGPSRSIYT
jgi:uncharacterized protein